MYALQFTYFVLGFNVRKDETHILRPKKNISYTIRHSTLFLFSERRDVRSKKYITTKI